MGIDSSISIGYGFRIPESDYNDLLRKDPEDNNYYIEDGQYTHVDLLGGAKIVMD